MENEKKINQRKPLSNAIKLFWGIGNGVMVLGTTMSSYFQTYWLTDIAMFSATSIALMDTANTLINLFAAPIIGALMDVMRPLNKKWGRYRSWLLVGSLIAILTAPLSWIRFGNSEAAAAIIRVILMVLIMIPITFRTQADNALLTVVCKTPNDRSLLAARKYMYSNIFRLVSNIIVTAVVTFLLARGIGEGTSYIILAVGFAVLTFFGFFAQFKLTEEYEGEKSLETEEALNKSRKAKISLLDVLKNLFANPQLLWLLIANICTTCVAFILTRCATYYWKAVAENFAMMGTYSLLVNGLGIVGTIVAGKVAGKFDNIKMSRFALIGMLVTIALVKPLGLHNQWLFIAVISVHQFFASFNYPIFVAGYANCATYAEWKTGKKTAATIMSISGYPLRFAPMITSWFIPQTLKKVGYVAGEACSEATKAGIVGIYSTWGPIFMAGALIIMFFFYKLNNTKMEAIQQELDARKAQA